MRVQISLLPLLVAASAFAASAAPLSPPASHAGAAADQGAAQARGLRMAQSSDWAPPSARGDEAGGGDSGANRGLNSILGNLIGGTSPSATGGESLEKDSDSADSALDSFLNNLIGEMRPALGQIGDGLDQLSGTVAPLLKELTAQMDDLRNYDPPERLENGDILIRRKTDAPPPPELGPTLRHYTTPLERRGQDPSAPEPGTRPNDDGAGGIPGLGTGPATDL